MPSNPGVLAHVSAAEASTGALGGREVAWLLVARYELGERLTLTTAGPPVALVRALSRAPALGLVGCGGACAAKLESTLEDPAERARLEQALLRGTEQDGLDGLAVDLRFLPALGEPAVAFVEDLAAAAHAGHRKAGALVRMSCRASECEGVRGALGRVVRAADAVSLDELDEDVQSPDAMRQRRLAVLAAELGGVPARRVFLGVAGASDLAVRIALASERGLGGVDVGLLGETPACTFDVLAAERAKRPAPPCP